MERPLLMLTFLLPALACGEKCDLDGSLRARAGAGGVDCGRVEIGGDRGQTDACVVEAFNAGKPFFARYERRGTDSHVAFGLVRGGDGVVTMLLYDGDPGGGGGDGRPVISGSVCEGPSALGGSSTADASPITCAASRSIGRVCE
jgi:hypothetical protein